MFVFFNYKKKNIWTTALQALWRQVDDFGHKMKSLLFSFWSLFPRHLPSSASEAQRDELQYHVSDMLGGEAVKAQHGETSFLSNSSGLTN